MGLYNQGIYGPYSGRVGNVIGSFWNGRCVMRIRAASFTDANTIPQQTQRMKWKLVAAFVKANSKLIKLGMSAVDEKLTAFNNAMKLNIPEAITGTFPELSLDLTKVTLSKGNLLGLGAPVLTSTVPGSVSLAWTNNSNNADAFETDQLKLSIIDSATGESLVNSAVVTRGDESAVITLPTGWSSRLIHVLGFFVREGLTQVTSMDQVSDSDNLGTVTVA